MAETPTDLLIAGYQEIDEATKDEVRGRMKWRTDLWAGGDKNSTKNPEKSALLNCEDSLTRNAQMIINPPSNEPVDSTPLDVRSVR